MKGWITSHFLEIQIAISALFLFLWFRGQWKQGAKSQFRVREADRTDLRFERGSEKAAQSAQAKAKPTPFQLTGIRIDAPPHEILGVSITATEAEIQKAYRELMKRFHPDAIGRPDSREWKDAQIIANAITQARQACLERAKKR